MFQVGDVVEAIDNYYGITNKRFGFRGTVTDVIDGEIIVQGENGGSWRVYGKHFALCQGKKIYGNYNKQSFDKIMNF